MRQSKRQALAAIRRCLAGDRYRMTLHFRRRMSERGLIWPDVLAVVDAPSDVRERAGDEFGRDKWIICGEAVDGLGIELVCILDLDEQGRLVILVTAYTV